MMNCRISSTILVLLAYLSASTRLALSPNSRGTFDIVDDPMGNGDDNISECVYNDRFQVRLERCFRLEKTIYIKNKKNFSGKCR